MPRPRKPPSNKKAERNQLIYDIYNNRHDLSLEDIGKMFNISRARVHVIVKNMEQKEAKVEASTLNN